MRFTANPGMATWLPAQDELVPFYSGVANFVQSFLTEALAVDQYKTEKSIVDPILGYIHLQPWEIALLDTRLFQRLRHIRQLGLAYLVFPTVGYSRFEHTLGVMGSLANVLSALQENHARANMDVASLSAVIDEYRVPIRLAALFHDVGHVLFSHAGERIVAGLGGRKHYPSTQTIRTRISNHFGSPKTISTAEVLSITILGSPQVPKFLDRCSIPAKTPDKTKEWIEAAARLIIGLPIPQRNDTVFLAQLISSGLDVDKLDYMAREAFFSGIKLELDVARLLDKMRVFKLDVAKLPKRLEHYKRLLKAEERPFVLGLAKGGQFAFEEFCISRVALYEKMYLHQKIRSAEAQLSAALRRIPERYPEYKEAHRWLYLQESQILHPGAELPALDPDSIGPLFDRDRPQRNLFGLGFEKIDGRNLLHRGFAFGPAISLTDPPQAAGSDMVELDPPSLRLVKDIEKDERKFRDAINSELKSVAQLLGQGNTPEALDRDLIIDTPRYAAVQQGHESIYFDRPTRLPIRWIMPIDRIVEYYTHNRALGFVFAPKEYAPRVMLACEMAMWRIGAALFVQEGSIPRDTIDKGESLRHTLSQAGYYDDTPQLKPIPEYLVSAEAQERILDICQNLSQFKSQNGQQVTVAHLTTFISQFPEPLMAPALKMLQLMEMIDEDNCKEAVHDALRESRFSGRERSIVAPLGSASDSAGRLLYALRELEADTLTDATVRRADHLAFYDDNINSGLQTLNIFAEWLGYELPDELDLNEEHVQQLGDEARSRLRELPITLIFAVGSEGADEKLRGYLTLLGISNDNIEIYIRRRLPADERLFSGGRSRFQDDRKIDLGDFLSELGARLLVAEGKSEKTAKERALGYGGAQALVAFPYNVPTMTITALWCRSRSDKETWIPLLERRRRTKDGQLGGEDK